MAQTQTAEASSSNDLANAVRAVEDDPTNEKHWQRLEELLEAEQQPDALRGLFGRVLANDLTAEVANDVGRRAVRFFETWYGADGAALGSLLERVIEIDPSAEWAFERLSVAYTLAAKWDALLAAYDRAIEQADETSRRARLLEEAAQVAKDFASEPDRAIAYMEQLYGLDPSNTALGVSLERLLERQKKWDGLVALWTSRLERLNAKQARESRLKIAKCHADKRGDWASALEQVDTLLADKPDYKPALELLERLLDDNSAGAAERRRAMLTLKAHHVEKTRPTDVVRVLERGLDFAEVGEKPGLLRELVERLVDLGEDAQAMRHQSALLVLEPLPREQEELRALAERTRDFAAQVEALIAAAKACDTPVTAIGLRMEAARTREEALGDEAGAIALYETVFGSDAPPNTLLEAGRRLVELLEKTDRQHDTLAVLAKVSELEPTQAARREVLGRLARLADALQDAERARTAWQACLQDDPLDVEALDALIEAVEANQQWQELVSFLERRTQAPGAADRRRDDLVWLARVHAEQLGNVEPAIEVWRKVRELYGGDRESVSALSDLLARAEHWNELAELLQQAAGQETERFTELQTRLGDAYRERLDKPDLAVLRYRAALQIDPANVTARAGLQALSEDERSRAPAIDALADACAQRGEWKQTLALLEQRLDIEPSAERRAELLIEAADLHEHDGSDPQNALACLRRAFALVPEDRQSEREIRRLAEQLDAWDAVVQAYGDTIARFSSPTPRMAELSHEQGVTLEQRLADKEGALAAYTRAARSGTHRIEHAEAAVRVAAELGRWDDAASLALEAICAAETIEARLVDPLEAQAQARGAWPALATAFGAALQSATVDGALGCGLYARVAQWQLDQCQDAPGAEASLALATNADPRDVEVLERLIALRRAQPSAALVEALCTLADLHRDLGALREAAEVAVGVIDDVAAVRGLLVQLYETAALQLARKQDMDAAREAAAWASETLVNSHMQSDEGDRALAWLLRAAELDVDAPTRRGFKLRAAALAAELGREASAIDLYEHLWRDTPDDRDVMEHLATLCRKQDRLPELAAVLRHRLSLEKDEERALALRLEIAEVAAEVEARIGRLAVLRDNLRVRPAHPPTLDAIEQALRGQQRLGELGTLLGEQARAIETRDAETSRQLWRKVATLYETEIGDAGRAIDAYRELHRLEPEGDAPEALARLFSGRGQPDEAKSWLELRLQTAPPETRAVAAVELARVHLETEDRERARAQLESALAQNASLRDARALLADVYRREAAWPLLARLLEEGAEVEPDPDRKLAGFEEAARIYIDTVGDPARAVNALKGAAALRPDDPALGLRLVHALRAAKQLEEARAILDEMIKGFGRKRSPERAELHYQLAQVEHADGALDKATEQLERATQMDAKHVDARSMLARLQREQGDLDAAERTLRGLLMVVRRQMPDAEDATGPAEVFFELSSIAEARGEEEQATELLESAMELATQSDAEAKRFQRVLVARTQTDLLMRLLDARLDLAQEPGQEAEVLAAKADVLAGTLQRPSDALKLLLDAVKLEPDNDAWHESARSLARANDDIGAYTDLVNSLAEDAGRKRSRRSRALASHLLLKLGRVVEEDVGDLDRAAALYGHVEALGEHTVEAWMATARVAGARGDRAEQRRVLQHIAELGPDQASKEQRNEALHQLAEVELDRDETRDVGVMTLERAMHGSRDHERARRILRSLLERGVDHPGVLDVVERVARAAHDDGLLLMWFERRAAQPDCTLDDIREGAELARRADASKRELALLERGVQLAQALEDSHERSLATWVFVALADALDRAGDNATAIARLQEGLPLAEGEAAEVLARRLASIAAGPDGNLEAAAEAYEKLLEAAPGDPSLWEPLLDVYRRIGDRGRFEAFIEHCLDAVIGIRDRVALRLAHAQFLAEVVKDERAATMPLRAVLDDEPGHAEATPLLVEIYKRNKMGDELATLLTEQFDRARDQQDGPGAALLALELGKLYGKKRRDDAIDVYRQALEHAPDDSALLRTLLDSLGKDADPAERAELTHRLLSTASSDEAEALALALAEQWTALEQPDRALDALALGQRAAPDSTTLRDRLEAHYAANEMWRPLAELLERVADASSGPEALARFKNAATLYRDELNDLEAAANALRRAIEFAPGDLSLFGELARNLAAAGRHAEAIDDVTELLDKHPDADRGRCDLLRVRAELELAIEKLDDAVRDLEEAWSIDPTEVAHGYADALERLKAFAFTQNDPDTERAAVMKLVAVHDTRGDATQARQVLVEWMEQTPNDVEALRSLRDREQAAERWEDLARTCEQLIELEEGAERAQTALLLADACSHAGTPEAARAGLERVHAADPDSTEVRAALRRLYQTIGARAELAKILVEQAETVKDVDERVVLLHRATELYLQEDQPEAALEPLQVARKLRSDDKHTQLLLIDINVQLGKLDDAQHVLEEAIGNHKRRRSPELALLQQRMSRVCAARGNVEEQLHWLNQAIEADRQSAEVASELAEVAMEHASYDAAMKALRSLTMMDDPKPITRAMAFLKQAQIAFLRGDARRAQHWARKAKSLDDSLAGIDEFLEQLGVS